MPPTEAKRRRSRGGVPTTELVLAAAATCVVGVLSVSVYRTQSVRAQVSASLQEASAAQALVVAAFERRGTPPRDATTSGIDKTAESLLIGVYVQSLRIENGRIDLRFGETADPAIAGKTLSLTPFETADGEVVWICGNEFPDTGLNPLGFAGGGAQATTVRTSIDDRFLPPACR